MFRIVTRALRPFCQSKKPPYIHPYNINREQDREWTKKVQKQLAVESAPVEDQLPRRKRRVYQTEKFNTDISGFAAWRVYDDDRMYKLSEYECPVALKLMLSPKLLKHCFGQGYLPENNPNSASREYFFQDSNLSQYLLYDFRCTTLYKPNVPGYDYQNQQHVEPRRRKTYRYAPEDFWQLDQEFEFRVNATKYADHHKFKVWLLKALKEGRNKSSYDSFIDEKFGKVCTFNKLEDAAFYKTREPLVAYVDKSHYAPLGASEKAQQQKSGAKQEKKQKKDKKDKKAEKAEKTDKTEKDDKLPTKETEEPFDILKEAEALPDTYVEVKRSSFVFAKRLPEQFRIDQKDSISAFTAVFQEADKDKVSEKEDGKKPEKKNRQEQLKGRQKSENQSKNKSKQPKQEQK